MAGQADFAVIEEAVVGGVIPAEPADIVVAEETEFLFVVCGKEILAHGTVGLVAFCAAAGAVGAVFKGTVKLIVAVAVTRIAKAGLVKFNEAAVAGNVGNMAVHAVLHFKG